MVDSENKYSLGDFQKLNTQKQKKIIRNIFEDYYPYVYRLSFSLCNNASDAEDIAQDVFIAVINGLPSFRGDAKFSTWVYRITTRIACRHIVKNKHQPLTSSHTDTLQSESANEPEITHQQLAKAMNKLSLPLRTVLSLTSIIGLSHQQVADIMGVPVGTIWSRLHSGRKQLAKILDYQ
ncbi:MAG: hypothetical protein DRQ47_00220 [Gammaproteobacteria bacterium]|nr:MAG: hypothetical protein DRQ47_00220 [Gammaproteobacteria bacterium]